MINYTLSTEISQRVALKSFRKFTSSCCIAARDLQNCRPQDFSHGRCEVSYPKACIRLQFSDRLASCIDQYLQECQLFILPEDIHSLKEYAEFVQKCNEDTAEYITNHIEEYCRQNQK